MRINKIIRELQDAFYEDFGVPVRVEIKAFDHDLPDDYRQAKFIAENAIKAIGQKPISRYHKGGTGTRWIFCEDRLRRFEVTFYLPEDKK